MHICRRTIIVLFALCALPGVAPGQTGTAVNTPDAVVRALLSAMDAKDANGIRNAFSPSASQAYGNGTPKTGPAFSAWLQSDIIAAHGRVENPQLVATGDEVVVTGRYRNSSGYSSAANFLFKVSNGQITSWQMRY
jgi:SnoaL-like domain